MPSEQIGRPFRQIAPHLRWIRPGFGQVESKRPFDKVKGFLDLEQPTLITFEAADAEVVNISNLLQIGAIAPYEPPKPAKRQRGGGDGEGRSEDGPTLD